MALNQLKEFKKLLICSSLDGIFLDDRATIRHLSGYSGNYSAMIAVSDSMKLFVPYAEYQLCKDVDRMISCHCCAGNPAVEALKWLEQEDIRTVGFDSRRTPSGVLNNAYSKVKNWIDISESIYKLRIKKQPSELEKIKRAAEVSVNAINSIISTLRDGIREKDVQTQLNIELIKNSGNLPAFDSMVAFGKNTSSPHWISNETRLSPGDSIIVDCGAKIDEYCADITRTFFWKRASARQIRRYRIVLEAVNRAVEKLQIGNLCSCASTNMTDYLESVGLADYFAYSLGHGIGLEVHEAPTISESSVDVLFENSVMAIEPGIFIPGWGGIRIEEMIWLSSDGPEFLTKKAGINPIIGS